MYRFFYRLPVKFPALAFPFLTLALMALVACEDVSPALGKYYKGRTLHLSVVTMERAPELRYTLGEPGGETRHYRIAPEDPANELALLRLRVQNHTATSAIVSIDQNAAELRDFFHDKYYPVDVHARPEEIAAPEGGSGARIARCPMEHPSDLCFLWNPKDAAGDSRSYVLEKGFGVEGWLLFEVPRDAQIRELRWRAGDGLTVEF